MAISFFVFLFLLNSLCTSFHESSEHRIEENSLEENYYCDLLVESSGETPECISPWTFCDNGTCKCGDIPHNVIQCHLDANSTIPNSYCVTYEQFTQTNEIGVCILSRWNKVTAIDELTTALPKNVTELTETVCGPFNRTGTLCGKCKDGHYPLAYSYDMNCVECPDGKSNWWKFVLAAFLPLTVFYFIILFFQINVTSSYLHGFVFCSQSVVYPQIGRVILLTVRNQHKTNTIVRLVGSLLGIWNLDFFFDFLIWVYAYKLILFRSWPLT